MLGLVGTCERLAAQGRVVVVVAARPRHFGREGGEEVVDGEGDDHVVINADERVHHDVPDPDTCKRTTYKNYDEIQVKYKM